MSMNAKKTEHWVLNKFFDDKTILPVVFINNLGDISARRIIHSLGERKGQGRFHRIIGSAVWEQFFNKDVQASEELG